VASGWPDTHIGFAAHYRQKPSQSLTLGSDMYYGNHMVIFQKFKSSQTKTNGNFFSAMWCSHVVSKPASLSPFPPTYYLGQYFLLCTHLLLTLVNMSAPKQARESFTKMRKGNRGRHRKHNRWGNPKDSTSGIKLSLNCFLVLLLSH